MGASCSTELTSSAPQPPANLGARSIQPPPPSRMTGTAVGVAQPPQPCAATTSSRAFDHSASSRGSCLGPGEFDERRGSVGVQYGGSVHSASTVQPLYVGESSGVYHPPMSPLGRSNPPPSGRPTVIRAIGGISQSSLHSTSVKHHPNQQQQHRRRGASMSTCSADSTNTWTQFVPQESHPPQAHHHFVGGEPLWALANFHCDNPPLSF